MSGKVQDAIFIAHICNTLTKLAFRWRSLSSEYTDHKLGLLQARRINQSKARNGSST